MFPLSVNRVALFFICIVVVTCSFGCSSEPVKSGPSITTKLSPSAAVSETGKAVTSPVKAAISSSQWDEKLISAIPAGFICLGTFKEYPSVLAFDEGSLPLLLNSASVGRVVEAIRKKIATDKAGNGSLARLFYKRPFAFALMPVAGKELARFVFLTSSGGDFEEIVRSFPSKDDKTYSMGTDLLVCISTIGDFLVLASDSEIISGVSSTLAGTCPSMIKAPLTCRFRPQVTADAIGSIYCDLPAMVGAKPGFASIEGAIASTDVFKRNKLFSSVKGAMVQVAIGEDLSLNLQGVVLKRGDGIRKGQIKKSIIGTRLAGETVDAMVSFSLDIDALFSNEKELVSFLPDSIASIFQAAVDRSKGTLTAGGIDFEKEVKPFISDEVSLILSWKLRYPQLAVLLKIKDSNHWVDLMSKLRTHLQSKDYVFSSRKVGDQFVYFTREQSISADILEPAFVITPQFLIIASGRHVLDSILLDREKLEGTALLTKLLRLFNGKIDNLAYFNTDLLGRFVESGERRVQMYTPAAQGQCNANMVQMTVSGKATVFCPSGGSYQISKVGITCSLHGTVAAPLNPAQEIRDSLKAVKNVQMKYKGLALGTSRISDEETAFRMILQPRTQ